MTLDNTFKLLFGVFNEATGILAAGRHRSARQLPAHAKRPRKQLISGTRKRREERTKAASFVGIAAERLSACRGGLRTGDPTQSETSVWGSVRYAAPYHGRGEAYRAKGDNDRAIADYDQAIQFDPKYAAAYKNRGYTYLGRGDHDWAIAAFDQALKLNPSLAKSREGLARVQGLLAKPPNPGTQTNAPTR